MPLYSIIVNFHDRELTRNSVQSAARVNPGVRTWGAMQHGPHRQLTRLPACRRKSAGGHPVLEVMNHQRAFEHADGAAAVQDVVGPPHLRDMRTRRNRFRHKGEPMRAVRD